MVKSLGVSRMVITGAALGLVLYACSPAATGGEAVGASGTACAAQAGWPTGALRAAKAHAVDAAQVLPADQLRDWGKALDAHGLRDTGGKAHEAYIDEIIARLTCAGVAGVKTETVPFERWSVDAWSLAVAEGPQAGPVKVAAYVPYSGMTSEAGVTAPLVYLGDQHPASAGVAGKIVLFDVPAPPKLPFAFFTALALDVYDPEGRFEAGTYSRPYLASPADLIKELSAAGAAGGIAILDLPYETAYGTYVPYEGEIRTAPSLYVDKAEGARLKALADGGTRVTLALPAQVHAVETRNIVAVIPGASDELIALHSHSDGTNGIEDNGPDAIVGIAQYLSRLPRAALPRSILIVITGGHFIGGIAAERFLDVHKSDGLRDRIKAMITLEHLGALEWVPDAGGILEPTGKTEPAVIFQPKIQALADASYRALKFGSVAPAAVLQPMDPGAAGTHDDAVWPGEGQYFWGQGRIPNANYISGPYYLLNWGVSTVDKIDYEQMRRETVAFTQMLLELSRVPVDELSREADKVTRSDGL